MSLEPTSLRSLVTDAVDLMTPVAEARGIALSAPDDVSDIGYAMADNQRVKQVLVNLINNAVKYNRDGGEVEVAVSQDDDIMRLEVRDTGPGIPDEKMSKLFVPFERLGAETTNIEGVGLGLALSRTLVASMGGTIGVESTVGQGSTFWVELAHTEPAALEELTREEHSLVETRDYEGERSLLYVDDTPANIELVQEILTRRPRVKLLPAMQGTLGLELARRHRPDMILLDLHLPDLGGEEVLERLRLDTATRDIPVVVLSADATKRQFTQLQQMGVQDYLIKPIRVKRLLAVLDEHLENGGRPVPSGARAA
jgi:CheY-like chemotaxis protein/anti-sigma regulatory factor (Ser/Thr protein kinase)